MKGNSKHLKENEVEKVAELGLFVGVILALVVMSVQFMRGKWLRMIAGNRKGDPENPQAQRCLGKVVGGACLFVTFVLVLFQMGLLSTPVMYVTAALACLSTVVVINQPDKKG